MVVNRSSPRATVVPILVYEDVGKAIDWLCGTFGFTERLRAARPGGSVTHAQLAIAEGAVMLGRQGAEFRPPRPNEVCQYVTVHVEDVDKHFEHARQRGAHKCVGCQQKMVRLLCASCTAEIMHVVSFFETEMTMPTDRAGAIRNR